MAGELATNFRLYCQRAFRCAVCRRLRVIEVRGDCASNLDFAKVFGPYGNPRYLALSFPQRLPLDFVSNDSIYSRMLKKCLVWEADLWASTQLSWIFPGQREWNLDHMLWWAIWDPLMQKSARAWPLRLLFPSLRRPLEGYIWTIVWPNDKRLFEC